MSSSVNSRNAEMSSPVEIDFERSSDDECRSPDVEEQLLRRDQRRRNHAVEFRDDVPDNDDDDVGGRRKMSLKQVEIDDGGENLALEPVEFDKPLSSGWAAALAAASAAGSVRAAAKRRTNVGRTNVFVPPPTRSLLCLSLTNPLRKLTISVVEWKYPLVA